MIQFYADPAFFVIAAVLAVPAVVLGVLEKHIRFYGMVVTLVLLALLFGGDAAGIGAFVFFLVVATSCAYATKHLFSAQMHHAVAVYRLLIVATIMPLVAAKVSAVFDANILGFIGLSYVTFKAVQVLIEMRDGLIKELNVLDYWYFLLFFPVFTSGPITRSREFMGQVNTVLPKQDYLDLLSKGLLWLVKGLVYMFVLAAFFQWLMWFGPSAIGTGGAAGVASEIVYALAYGLHLFFDFAGYSLMAMALGTAFGIQVPFNFKAPFRSIDIKDFWNRWHITLSFWLRDYVFMRVSKALIKRKIFESRTTTACIGFMCDMTLMGVWHGLNFDCIAYGVYHGLLLAGTEVFQKKSKLYKKYKKETWFKGIEWAITMVLVFFGFALFSGQVSAKLFGGM